MSVRHPMAGAVLGLAALVVSLAAVNLVLRHAGYTTTLRYARMAVEHEATADSWRPMLQALDAWDRGEPVYQTVFFTEHVKFQYPLTTLFLPMALRSPSRTGNALIKALNRVSLAVSAVCVACTAALFVVTWFGPRPDWRDWPIWLGLGTIVAGSVLFHPVLMSYVLGQIQSFVNAALAAMLLAWRLNRRIAAGVALGIACLIKPHFALLIVWGLLRRAWSFAASTAVVIAIGGAAALAVFGVRDNLDYARVVSYMAARGEAITANQSVNGLLNRLVQPPEAREWDFHSFPPPHPVVRAGTFAAALVLVGAALMRAARARLRRNRPGHGDRGSQRDHGVADCVGSPLRHPAARPGAGRWCRLRLPAAAAVVVPGAGHRLRARWLALGAARARRETLRPTWCSPTY